MSKLFGRLCSDETLMLRYQRGDSAAFDTVYRRHRKAVFAFLLRSGAHPDAVEEIFQEAWAGIIRNIASYAPTAKFRTYLFQVAHNRLVDHWRRRKYEQALDEQALQLATDALANTTAPVDADLTRRDLLRMLASLPAEQRCALILRHQGFSQQEIADITGVGTETVKSRLRYASNSLRTAPPIQQAMV